MKCYKVLPIFLFFVFLLILSQENFSQDGQLDATFGQGGIVTTDIDPLFGSTDDEITKILLQTDGKIIAAGNSYNPNTNNFDFALVRYKKNGVIDSTFGTHGRVITAIGVVDDWANSAALQSDGKIVLAGYKYNGSDNDFIVVRYDSSGVLDNSFGTNGIVITQVGSFDDEANSVAIQTDEKIVVGGTTSPDGSRSDFALVRYNINGDLDITFGTNGISTTHAQGDNCEAFAIAIQNDGKIVEGGYVYHEPDPIHNITSIIEFALARFDINGNLDNSFGISGVVNTIVFLDSVRSVVKSLAIQSDGKIIAAGIVSNLSNDDDFAVVRYNTDGDVDNTFGGGGIVITTVGPDEDELYTTVIQTDGKILAAGYTEDAGETHLAIVRYDSTGALDDTFGSNGLVTSGTISFMSQNYDVEIASLALQSDGKILAGGTAIDINGNYNVFILFRYNNDSLLPVELNSFTAEASEQGSIKLQWATATEINNLGFEVQKKINVGNTDWQKIAFVNGKGNSTIANHYSFVDKYKSSGDFLYRLKQIDFNGNFKYSPEVEVGTSVPSKFALEQNYPNPFNPITKIKYSIPNLGAHSDVSVLLVIYDILGNEVATLVNEKKKPGNYETTFDGSKLSSGVYFYSLASENFYQTKKIILLK